MARLSIYPTVVLFTLLSCNFSHRGVASVTEDEHLKQVGQYYQAGNHSQSKEYLLSVLDQYPHGPLLITQGNSEEDLISNWSYVQQLLVNASKLYPYSGADEQLTLEQGRKQRKLRDLGFHMAPSNNISKTDQDKIEYVAFAQICSFDPKTPKEVAQQYSVKDTVLQRYLKSHVNR